KCGEPVASCAPLADHGQIGQQRTALPYGKRQSEVIPDSGLEIPQDTNPQPSHRAPRLTYRIAAGTIARPQIVFHGHFPAAVTLSSHRLCKLTVPGFVIRVSLVAMLSQESHGTMSSNPRHEANGSVPEPTDGDRYLAEYAPLLDGSAAMRAIRQMVESIADTDATVLLRGESG